MVVYNFCKEEFYIFKNKQNKNEHFVIIKDQVSIENILFKKRRIKETNKQVQENKKEQDLHNSNISI